MIANLHILLGANRHLRVQILKGLYSYPIHSLSNPRLLFTVEMTFLVLSMQNTS